MFSVKVVFLSILTYLLATLASLLLVSCQPEEAGETVAIQPHREDWAVYLREAETEPAVITVDLGWAKPAPVATHPRLMTVVVEAKEELPTGFPTEAEVEIVNELQDKLILALERKGEGVFVGSRTSIGRKALYFYLNSERPTEQKAWQLMKAFRARPHDMDIRTDSAWLAYFEILLPNEREMAEIHNERVLQQLQRSGDRLTQPRGIEHWFYFPTTDRRDRFLEALQTDGFELIGMDTLKDESPAKPYSLHLIRQDSIQVPYIHELTWQLTQAAREYEGEYDGWETVLVR